MIFYVDFRLFYIDFGGFCTKNGWDRVFICSLYIDYMDITWILCLYIGLLLIYIKITVKAA